MNVYYLTTHVYDEDFASAKVAFPPNPAGQNFHGKLIRALATQYNVHVLSLVPTSLHLPEKDFTVEGIHYHYINPPISKIKKAFFFPQKLLKILKESVHDGDVLFYDPLNRTCSLCALKAKYKAYMKIVAILTDDIKNITGAQGAVATIYRLTRSANASYALTKNLVETYWLNARPHLVRPMLVEQKLIEPYEHDRPYVYYGGALFVKDGTKDLIDAYRSLSMPNFDLIIAGHGDYKDPAERDCALTPGMRFVGQVSKEEHYAYIAGSSLAINPRRYNKDLDEHAVPSKVMEYLTYASYIASTLSTPIKEEYGEDINWLEGDLKDFFVQHMDVNGNLVGLVRNNAKNAIISKYGISETGRVLREFIDSLGD